MRVVQLVTQAHGGPVDHAVDVARELAARGHDSHLIGPPLNAVTDGVHRHAAAMATKADVRGALGVARLLADLRPDVLHCQDRRAGLIGRAVGRALPRRPRLVYTLHGVPDGLSDLVPGNVRAAPRRSRDRWYYLTGERILRGLTGASVVVPCEALARYAVDQVRLPAPVVHVVVNGVDTDRFRPAARVGGPRTTALWLGLMGPVKRLDVLVRAAAEVPDLDLLLVGDGPERERIQAEAAAAGLTERARFREHVSDPAPVFAEADVFALPSAAEACPLAVLQAMACGLPVVASRVGGVPEIVRDGTDGLLVPAGDTAALAGALRRLVGDAPLRAAMGSAAREHAASSLSLRTCVDGLLDVYRAGRR